MDSFSAKIGWGQMRKRENENYPSVSFHSYPTRNRKFQKNRKKYSKNSKILLWIRLKPKLVGERCERPKIKIIVPFCSHPMRNRKIQKNSKKIKKNIIMASFQTKIGWKRPRKRKNKSYRSVSFLPNASYKISKK